MDNVVLDCYELLFNEARLDVAEDIFSENVQFFGQGTDTCQGIDAMKNLVTLWHEGFPDMIETIDMHIDAGEYSILRFTITGTHTGPFMGFAPTGKKVRMSGLEIFRSKNGQVEYVEFVEDLYSLFEQIGVVPKLQY